MQNSTKLAEQPCIPPEKNDIGDAILQIKPAVSWNSGIFSCDGQIQGELFHPGKGQRLALTFREKASESWVTVLDSKPIQHNRESENILSTHKYKTLLLLTLMMLSFLSEGLLEDTLWPIKIYREIVQMMAPLWMLSRNFRFRDLKGHNLTHLLTPLSSWLQL